jgi:hypothetical protein
LLRLFRLLVLALLLQLQPSHGRQEPHRLGFGKYHRNLLLSDPTRIAGASAGTPGLFKCL